MVQHQSYNQQLKEVHLPSALSQTVLDHDLAVRIHMAHDAPLDMCSVLHRTTSLIFTKPWTTGDN